MTDSPSGTLNPSSCSIGLTSQQLQLVFPFHIAVNSLFIITQVGTSLSKYFRVDESNQQSILIGKHISDFFSVSSPPCFSWDFKRLKMGQHLTYNLDLKDISATNFTIKKELPLSGGVVISDPSKDPLCNEPGAIFLVNLRIRHTTELTSLGFTLNDISHFAFQKELIFAGEHLRTELNTSHKLEQITKSLEEERSKTLRLLETKRSFVRYVSHEIRTPLNIVVMGLGYFQELMEYLKTELLTGKFMPPNVSGLHENGNIRSSVENLMIDSNSELSTQSSTVSKDIHFEEIDSALADMKLSTSIAVDILNDLLLYEKIEGNLLSVEFDKNINTKSLVVNILQPFKLHALSKQIKMFRISMLSMEPILMWT